jgi:hypothetical protein
MECFRGLRPWLAAGLLAAVTCGGASAAPVVGVAVGQIEYVRTHDATAYPIWAPPLFWFTLKGVSSAGACQVWTPSNSVMFVSSDKSALSLILAAQMAGQQVEISFDDSKTVNGYCRAGFVTTGNPPPSV